ncbi:ABC transporter ATP-binding protein [Paracoccus zhejiangensis]|nr:ABC transporter ATP-binding protein [Paracoccus zhejiangensis]
MKTEMLGIEIENLHLAFGPTKVLTGVNLSIKPGEFFAFLGPSGSGKSTLLRSIAGFGPRPSGAIRIGGRDVLDLPPWKRNVGMVFQSYALWPHLSVQENVAFGLRERKLPGAEIARRVEEALDLVGLSHLAARMPNQLSGGQQQRIALARTVVIEPQVLLLDEPLSNLDASLRVQMRRELLALQRKLGLTTIFVTHDQEEANSTSDRMAVLDKGVIQQIGRPQELYDHPANLFVARFLGTANVLEGRVEKRGEALRFVTGSGDALPLPMTAKAGPSSIVLRPQNITISPLCGPDTIIGQVLHSEFLGSQIRYIVQAAGSDLVVDKSHHMSEPPLPTGAEVALQVNMDSAVLLTA